jgi:hypothetical protein
VNLRLFAISGIYMKNRALLLCKQGAEQLFFVPKKIVTLRFSKGDKSFQQGYMLREPQGDLEEKFIKTNFSATC